MSKDDKLIQSGRDEGSDRTNRGAGDRLAADSRDSATDPQWLAEKLALLENVDTVLPAPPTIPGYHTIWLTTTNTQDSLERRYQLGYTLVTPEEVPGFNFGTHKSGSSVSSDRITINEMVLAKLPLQLYEAYLTHNHHTRPLKQEEAISADNVISKMRDGRNNVIGIVEGEGHKELGKARPANFKGVQDAVA